jgi:hypothetical protein
MSWYSWLIRWLLHGSLLPNILGGLQLIIGLTVPNGRTSCYHLYKLSENLFAITSNTIGLLYYNIELYILGNTDLYIYFLCQFL